MPLAIVIAVVFVMLYCFGGQTMVWIRRFVMPFLVGLIMSMAWWPYNFCAILWMGIFTEGDSDHGWLGWLRKPWLICAVYGLVCTIPPSIVVCLVHKHLLLLGAIPAISGLFIPDLPATTLTKNPDGTPKYSILWRDVLRSGLLVTYWLAAVMWR